MSRALAEALRVAIIGIGPKGLFALERLIAHLSAAAPAEAEIAVFDDAETPGAGPNYALDLPPYLRMNFADEQIDMWPPDPPHAPLAPRPSFVAWKEGEDGADRDPYPARASVGRYLADGYERLVAAAPERVDITRHRARVGSLAPSGDGWIADGRVEHRFDEVLLAPGHAGAWERGLGAGRWPHRARLVPRVFPVDRALGEPAIAAGEAVAIRGFALTMIDAALALTEGRGGRFVEAGGHRLAYEPAENSPAVLFPYSRTGRPMLAKTSPGWAQERGLEPLGHEATAVIRGLPRTVDVRADLAPAIGSIAASALERVGSGDGPSTALGRWVSQVSAGSVPASELTPAAELENSIAIAAGAAPPDHQWALGQAWRAAYPEVVRRLGGDGLQAGQWPAFRQLASEMERIAFGPPPLNAAKLLALVGSGAVDLSGVRGELVSRGGSTFLRSPHAEVEVDVVIDAVLPGPGAAGVALAPIPALLADGHVRLAHGRRGLELTPDVTCVGVGGRPTRGLGAVGRPTEDWVIGNDTLSRTLHDGPDRWARRVVARAVDGG